MVLLQDIPDLQLLQVFHRLRSGRWLTEHPPEKIPLADCADILAGPSDDGDGGISVVAHLFQSLAEGVVVVQIGNAAFGEQKVSDIHSFSSFLRGGWMPPIYASIIMIQEVREKLVNNL